MRSTLSVIILLMAFPGYAAPEKNSSAGSLDTARIEKLTGLKGKLDEKEGVFKVSAPRADRRGHRTDRLERSGGAIQERRPDVSRRDRA